MDLLCIQRCLYHGLGQLAYAGRFARPQGTFPRGNNTIGEDRLRADVAFEIHSPSDRPGQIQAKRRGYQERGVTQVWIDLEKRLVELIYPDRPLQYFQEEHPLIIDKLPGFSVDLKTLYSI